MGVQELLFNWDLTLFSLFLFFFLEGVLGTHFLCDKIITGQNGKDGIIRNGTDIDITTFGAFTLFLLAHLVFLTCCSTLLYWRDNNWTIILTIDKSARLRNGTGSRL